MALLLILGFTGLFILIFYPNIYLFGLDFTFNTNITPVFIPVFLVSIIMLIIKSVLQLRMERINYLSSIYDTVYSLYTGVITILFILNENIFTESFYKAINVNAYKISVLVISIVLGVLILSNIALKWYKTAKNY